MKARLIVAAIGVPLLLAVLCFAPPWAVTLLFSAVTALGSWELYHIFHIEKRLGALVLTMACSVGVQFTVYFRGYGETVYLFLPFMLLLFACWVAYYEREEPFGLEGLAASLFSGAFVALGLGAMTSLRTMERGNLLVLAPLVVTMLGDSGAYFAGRALGKRKMSRRTSPNKTVAGLVGGLLASALGMVIYGLVLRAFGLSGALWKLAVVGLVAGVAEQLGDLSFSLIKRHAGAKDYGNLLPGHGGAYDRFDSAAFAAPTVLVLLKLLEVF